MKIVEVRMGWSEGSSVVPSKMIMHLENSCFSHVYWVFVFDNGLVLMYESHISGGVQITPYEHLEEAIEEGRVKKIHEVVIETDPEVLQRLWEQCLLLHGDGYDKGQIVRYFLWIRLFRKKGTKCVRLNDNKKYTCNEFVVETGRNTIAKMSELDFSYTPEKLFKFINGVPSRGMYDEQD